MHARTCQAKANRALHWANNFICGENKKRNGQCRDDDAVNTSEGDLPVWTRTRNRLAGLQRTLAGAVTSGSAITGRSAASCGQTGAAAAKPLTRCGAKQLNTCRSVARQTCARLGCGCLANMPLVYQPLYLHRIEF